MGHGACPVARLQARIVLKLILLCFSSGVLCLASSGLVRAFPYKQEFLSAEMPCSYHVQKQMTTKWCFCTQTVRSNFPKSSTLIRSPRLRICHIPTVGEKRCGNKQQRTPGIRKKGRPTASRLWLRLPGALLEEGKLTDSRSGRSTLPSPRLTVATLRSPTGPAAQTLT